MTISQLAKSGFVFAAPGSQADAGGGDPPEVDPQGDPAADPPPVEDPPAGEPAAPAEPAPQAQSIDYDKLAQSVTKAMREAASEQQQQPAATDEDAVLLQISELQYSDPVAAERMRMDLAEKRAVARFAPMIQPMAADRAFTSVTEGIEPEGREHGRAYVQGLIDGGMSPDLINSDPRVRDLVTRAARDVAREKTPQRTNVRVEPAHGETLASITSGDRQAAADMSRILGITLTDEDIKEAARLEAG